jgi:PAS domain-containing protein
MSTLLGEDRRIEQRRRTKSRRLDERGPGVLENMSDAFVAVDRAWRYTYVNRAAENLIKRRREEVLGRAIWEIDCISGSRLREGAEGRPDQT